MDFLTEPVPNDEAIDFLKSKPAVTQDVFNKLLPELKARAFTVAGLEVAGTLQNVRDLVAELPAGGDWDTLKHQIAAKVSPFLVDDSADQETQDRQRASGDRKAELLLRLHGFQAYAVASHRALDAQRDIFPYCQYKSMGDGRVRATHRALHDIILPADDPFWNGHTGPWEWGCRCTKVGLMDIDVDEIRDADKDKPIEQRRLIEGEAYKQLTENGRLVKGLNEIYDVRTPVQKGQKNAFAWSPADLRLSLKDLRARYDEPTWAAFETWAQGAQLAGQSRSVWEWMTGTVLTPPDRFPALDELKKVRDLGGSTGAVLMEDLHGRQFVVKRGKSPEHIQEEATADALYTALGVPVPPSKLLPGNVKIADFLTGKTLGEYLKTAKSAEAANVLHKLREGFVIDALLGNWDVAGAGLDNVLIDKDGTPWRIDNGGSLRYRAQGAKKTAAEWGDVVSELDTLRDPNRNPQTARIFGGITDDEIRRQISALLDKRETVLSAAPEDLRDQLGRRMDNLAQRLAPIGEISPQFAQDVRNARVLGRTYLGDFDQIEDHNILFWQEKAAGGDLVTRAKLRITPAGWSAIEARIGGQLAAAAPVKPSGPRPLPQDIFWSPLEMVLKTVNHHAGGNGKYNPVTMKAFADFKKILLSYPAKGPDQEKMISHYKTVVEAIDQAVKTKSKTPLLAQYMVPGELSAALPSARSAKVEVAPMEITYAAKSRARGHAVEKGDLVNRVDGAYRISMDGVELSVAPWSKSVSYAHRGVATIRIPGVATPEQMQKAIALLKEIGIDAAPTPPETNELLYLRKGLLLADPDGAWKALADSDKPDQAKVADIKTYVRTTLGQDLDKSPDYKPEGQANTWGDGWRTWNRWDLPPSRIEKELPGYGLIHSSGGSLPEFVNSILDGGGQVTSTMERMRVGVSVRSGMSPDMDQETGGANYFFTRIATPGMVAGHKGLVFKAGLLSRADAFSFNGDRFGDVRPPGENTHVADPRQARGRTIADFRSQASRPSNETIFKNGLSLLDDVQQINTKSEKERQLLLDVFARYGITVLPDGRKVADIIQ